MKNSSIFLLTFLCLIFSTSRFLAQNSNAGDYQIMASNEGTASTSLSKTSSIRKKPVVKTIMIDPLEENSILKVNVRGPLPKDSILRFMDPKGNTLKAFELYSDLGLQGEFTIDIAAWESGMYRIMVEGDGFRESEKVLIP